MPYAEVVGDPIAHSKSPLIHKFWIERLGLRADYRACHVRPDALADYISHRKADFDWRGCNVTIPHKVAVIDLVDDPGAVRASIGAMNTVFRDADHRWCGTNTDAAGFWAPLADRDWSGAPVAVVGTGGAACAVLFALSRTGTGPVTVMARSPLKAAALLDRFGLKGNVIALSDPVPPVALLINASALGMTAMPPLDLDLSSLPDGATVYDLVYAPLETALLKAAASRGLDVIDGLDMLIGQAALAFELFFGAVPPREHDAELRALLTA